MNDIGLYYPKWNNDNLCYTPSFILPQDKRIFDIIKDNLKEDYNKSIEKN